MRAIKKLVNLLVLPFGIFYVTIDCLMDNLADICERIEGWTLDHERSQDNE